MAEEPEQKNPVKKHPSLPENYVTLTMLKERWLQRKKEEEEEKQRQQQQQQKQILEAKAKAEMEIELSKQNLEESRSGNDPRSRQRQPARDRRGAEGNELPERSAPVGKKKRKKRYPKKRGKIRVLENEEFVDNVGGKGKICDEFVDNVGGKGKISGGVEESLNLCAVCAVSDYVLERGVQRGSGEERRGRNRSRGRSRRNDNTRRRVKDVEVAKIDKSFRDLVLDGEEDGNVTIVVNGGRRNGDGRRARNGGDSRMRTRGGGGGGGYRRGYKGRVERAEGRFVWVQKGETSNGNTAAFSS